jgi:hypothetical protein
MTFLSGNTLGATYWTDGKIDAPMLPAQHWFIKCPHCNSLLWIDEQEELGKIEPYESNKKFKDSKSYMIPEQKDYFYFLNMEKLEREKEHYLRVQAWWSGNDKRRGEDINQPLSDEEMDNLLRLADMLDLSNERNRVLKAEILREIGQFEDAEDILQGNFKEDLKDIISLLMELIKRKQSSVAVIRR